MNDKQKLAAMGAEYRLTEEQAKGLAERMPQTGALQVIDDEPMCTEIRINGVEACGADIGGLLDRCLPHTTEQKPMCMAKRIEELEAQVRVMAELLRDARPYMDHRGGAGVKGYTKLAKEIDSALAGNLPIQVTSEGWQLVPVEVTLPMQHAYFGVIDKNMQRVETDCRFGRYDSAKEAYRAMLAAAPRLEPKP